jgi:hypothetical protein
MMKWKEQLNGDCPRRDAHGLHERCDLICPDYIAAAELLSPDARRIV